MDHSTMLLQIENYVHTLFQKDVTGHDFHHMKRVARTAKLLAKQEQADPFIAEAAGWVHDIGDKKLFKNPQQAVDELYAFLQSIGLTGDEINQIQTAVQDVSFSKGHTVPETTEGKIVQDADRLDAIGAIGIARTFAFGGAKGQLLYDEDDPHTSVQHFYDKLFALRQLMNTETAMEIAEQKHAFMEQFIQQFLTEWEGK